MTTDSPGQAGDTAEVHVTPAMIEAGVCALFEWSGVLELERFPDDEVKHLVGEILRAALMAEEGSLGRQVRR